MAEEAAGGARHAKEGEQEMAPTGGAHCAQQTQPNAAFLRMGWMAAGSAATLTHLHVYLKPSEAFISARRAAELYARQKQWLLLDLPDCLLPTAQDLENTVYMLMKAVKGMGGVLYIAVVDALGAPVAWLFGRKTDRHVLNVMHIDECKAAESSHVLPDMMALCHGMQPGEADVLTHAAQDAAGTCCVRMAGQPGKGSSPQPQLDQLTHVRVATVVVVYDTQWGEHPAGEYSEKTFQKMQLKAERRHLVLDLAVVSSAGQDAASPWRRGLWVASGDAVDVPPLPEGVQLQELYQKHAAASKQAAAGAAVTAAASAAEERAAAKADGKKTGSDKQARAAAQQPSADKAGKKQAAAGTQGKVQRTGKQAAQQKGQEQAQEAVQPTIKPLLRPFKFQLAGQDEERET